MSVLSQVIRGKQATPFKIIVYGRMGVGKSVFAAGAPSPIIMDTEDSTSEIDVARLPRPRNYEEILAQLQALRDEPHDYKTFVLDTIDAAEVMVWDYCIAQAQKEPKYAKITDLEQIGGGYGKGAVAALMAWRVIFAGLDALVEKRGMNVVLLGHAAVKKFNSPDVAMEPFDRYVIKLLPTTAAFVTEWPKAVMFADHETLTTEKNNKTFGVSTGKRMLHTTHSAAWDAKNRYGLPPTIELNWQAFESAARQSATVTVEAVKADIETVLKTKDVKTVEKVTEALARAGDDLQKLTTLLNWTRGQN